MFKPYFISDWDCRYTALEVGDVMSAVVVSDLGIPRASLCCVWINYVDLVPLDTQDMHVDRIGHGYAAASNASLMALLKERGTVHQGQECVHTHTHTRACWVAQRCESRHAGMLLPAHMLAK